eukprot:3934151-Rhodomonas_salina.1
MGMGHTGQNTSVLQVHDARRPHPTRSLPNVPQMVPVEPTRHVPCDGRGTCPSTARRCTSGMATT